MKNNLIQQFKNYNKNPIERKDKLLIKLIRKIKFIHLINVH